MEASLQALLASLPGATKDMDLDIPIILSESFFEYYTEYTDKQDFVGQLDFVMCQDAGEVINEKGLP